MNTSLFLLKQITERVIKANPADRSYSLEESAITWFQVAEDFRKEVLSEGLISTVASIEAIVKEQLAFLDQGTREKVLQAVV